MYIHTYIHIVHPHRTPQKHASPSCPAQQSVRANHRAASAGGPGPCFIRVLDIGVSVDRFSFVRVRTYVCIDVCMYVCIVGAGEVR
jgi:hypothetical protein